MVTQKSSGFFTYKNKKIITIILLLATFVIPLIGVVGVVLMWIWMKWKTWVKALITAPFVFTFLLSPLLIFNYLFVSRPVQIIGVAMEPNFKEGQYYLTNVLNEQEQIERGDVVIFTPPGKNNVDFIKRVVALPSESIMIQNGMIYINGQALDESSYSPIGETDYSTNNSMQKGEEIIVPTNHYFLLGDNRSKSVDSRTFGTIPRSSIHDKVGVCYWKCWQ